MATRMQQRRGTASEWTTANPVLAAGEIGYETDTGKFKFGDGVTAWTSLEYFTSAADLIDGAPEALDTLNELAAALNDDENFAATVTTALDLRIKGFAQTAADWANDTDPILPLSLLIETDTGKFKINHSTTNSNTFADLDYLVLQPDFDNAISSLTTDVSNNTTDIATAQTDIAALDTLSQANASAITSLQTDMGTAQTDIDNLESSVSTNSTDIGSLQSDATQFSTDIATNTADIATNAADIVTLQSDVTTLQADVSTNSTDISTLQTDVATVTTSASTNASDIASAQSDISDLQANKADIADPTFTGNVTLPSTTSIGSVTAGEIGHLSGVSADIQTQLDSKLASATAASTYAPLAGATLTGTVTLPATTSIGSVDSTEIGYLDGVTSGIQTQLNSKAPTESPTFTGTVSGVTASMVGLGNVDNTADADKPVSTATQTALDLKANLAGATFTGDVTVDTNLVVEGDLTVNGTNFAASATSITIEDNIVQLAHQNSANTVDLGLVVAYNDGAAGHAGIVRDVSDDTWKLFKGVTTEPATTVAFAEGSLDNLALNNLTAAGVVFTDGTQTKAGVPSLTEFSEKTASYTLDTLDHQDNIVEMNSASATTFTIPTDAALAWPVGASMDIFQTGAGQVTISGDTGVTVNYTPGNKLRTQWSSATILKRASNSWVIYGDLTA